MSSSMITPPRTRVASSTFLFAKKLNLFSFWAAALSITAICASPSFAEDAPPSSPDSFPSGLIQLPTNSQYYSPYAFVVDKGARTLTVWQQQAAGLKRVAQFPADMGKNTGDKKNRGDAKTPEGIYFPLTKLEGPGLDFKLYGKRAFTLDYPNFFDRMERKTGGGIWLHAVPDQVPLTRGSSGCVVVRNDVILDLTQYIRLGRTPVLIQEKTNAISQVDLVRENSELNKMLEDWRAAWQRKDIDSYISYYADEFRAMKMNREQWRDFKARLNEQYKTITVHLSKPAIFMDRNRVVVRFLQEYTSDQHSDFGEKVLYLKKNGENFKIVGENWSEETSKIAHDEIEATKGVTAIDKTSATAQ
jgi:murein L,D-transpeptidase YafK